MGSLRRAGQRSFDCCRIPLLPDASWPRFSDGNPGRGYRVGQLGLARILEAGDERSDSYTDRRAAPVLSPIACAMRVHAA